MRFFSNFDTGMEKQLVDEYKQAFGDDKVVSVHLSRWYYISRVVAPYVLFAILFCVGLYVVYMFEYEGQEIVRLLFLAIFVIYLLVVMKMTSSKYVDYTMDFLIVTPKEIIKYNQSGMFTRESETIHVDKIKSVSVSKHGVLNSFFDIGTIIFMAEGDDDKWDVVMPYVDAVESVEKQIRHVMGLDG